MARHGHDAAALPPVNRGFILEPTYRILDEAPVIHLFGKLETGEGFLVREHRYVPHFFLRAADVERARELGLTRVTASEKVTLDGREPVVRVDLAHPADMPPLRDRLEAAGVPCFEADLRFAVRYLIDRGVKGTIEILGWPLEEEESPEGSLLVFDDPEIRPASFNPELSVLSLDIETDLAASQVLSVALVGCGASEVLLLSPEGYRAPRGALPYSSEADLLRALAHRVRALDPDVLTGWNVVDFDLAVLARRALELGVRLDLGRVPSPLEVRSARRSGFSRARVPGRLVLDGIQLMRSSFVRMDEYSLDAVAREILGEGKTIHGGERGEEILRCFEHDRQRFVDYNLTDARLVLDILETLRLVELAVERSLLTGLPPDRVAGSIAAFDFLYLSELGPRGVVAPTAGGSAVSGEATHGGHVLSPQPGMYRNVLVFDFQSLYPSLIRTFQIDPLGFVPEAGREREEGLLVAPNGAAFRREPGILPQLLDELFPRRAAAKRAGDEVASYAIKILMNSFYGVLGTLACRFHNPAIANAITSFGRELLLWSKACLEEHGQRVLYGDTDSLFVESGCAEPEAARRLGEELAAHVNQRLAEHIRSRWRVESRLELKLEHLYLKLLLPAVRGGGAGARKRYAGLVDDGDGMRVTFTGMEVVRRDWTELAHRVQRELYERLFGDRPVADYLAGVVADLRAGRLDDALVYRKGLRKELDEYTSTTPPHVAAARKMSGEPGRVIAYVATTAGPEPADEREHPFDYEHYVARQIEPVAEPVLEVFGLSFRKVIGDDRQMELF